MSAIEVVLVGGSALHREGLRQSLDPSQFAVVAEGRSLRIVLDLMNMGITPRLVIADVNQLCEEDFEDLRRIRDTASACRIAVLSNGLDLEDLARVFKAGANGYLASDGSREAFSLSLLVMMGGETMLPGLLADVLTSDRERSDIQLSKDPATSERSRPSNPPVPLGWSQQQGDRAGAGPARGKGQAPPQGPYEEDLCRQPHLSRAVGPKPRDRRRS
jgi:two-component system, NarL family, nitrate/nitrite response regulator NarL